MFEAFKATLLDFDGSLSVHKPCFEPALAGAVRVALERMPREEARRILEERMPQYRIRW